MTDPALACERAGAHRHSLTNPAGLDFDVALYEAAAGCTRQGTATREHSWFPPAAWTVAACAGCGQQLGWFFDTGAAGFVGLILARIRIESGTTGH